MSKIILDYSDFYEDIYEYSREGNSGKVIEKKYKMPNDISRFFKKRGYCPFCKKDMPRVFSNTNHYTLSVDMWQLIDVWECDTCGWWEYSNNFSEEKDYGELRVSTKNWDGYKYGIVKKFNIKDKEIPISTLINELSKKKDILYDIDPYKLEDIAQVVFSSYYNCEVKHVGKSGDGGKDLIIIESDSPILVQVKRRSDPEHVELVKGVREFVGTMYIEDAKKGIYLSTAKDFSKGAKETADNLLNNRKLDKFDLINYKEFCNMLGVIKKDSYKPWMKLVEKIIEK